MRPTAIIAGAAAIAVAAGVGAYKLGYLDRFLVDPAIRACEAYTTALLQAPSTYRRVKAFISGNEVLLEYDAQNGFGATLRGGRQCTFSYYGSSFEMTKKTSSSTDEVLLDSHARIAVLLAGLFSVDASSTALKPSAEDKAVDRCIAVIKTKIAMPYVPDRDHLSSSITGSFPEGKYTVRVEKTGDGYPPNFPRTATCAFQPDSEPIVTEMTP